MKVQEIISTLKTDGWYIIEENGSYRQFKHPRKTGRLTIVGNLNYDLTTKPVDSTMLQAGLKGIKK